jgi:hypothetical protein
MPQDTIHQLQPFNNLRLYIYYVIEKPLVNNSEFLGTDPEILCSIPGPLSLVRTIEELLE